MYERLSFISSKPFPPLFNMAVCTYFPRGSHLSFDPSALFLTILNVTVDYTYSSQPSDMSFNTDLAGYTPRGTAMTDGGAEFLTLSLTT